MKRIVSLLLAVAMSVSAVPTAFAADTQDHSLGTQVVFTAANNENYTITVPASLNPGQSGTVTLDGYWPDSKTVTVTAEKTVTLKNSIKAADTKTLNVTFLGISEAGSNTSKQTFTEPVSVEGISNALFGTWSGKFNYNVEMVEKQSPDAIFTENPDGTVDAVIPPTEEPDVPVEIPAEELPATIDFTYGEFESTTTYTPGEYATVEYKEDVTAVKYPVSTQGFTWSKWKVVKDNNDNIVSVTPYEIALADIDTEYSTYIAYDFDTEEYLVYEGVAGDSVQLYTIYNDSDDTLENIIYLAAYYQKVTGADLHIAQWNGSCYEAVAYDAEVDAVDTFTVTTTVTKTKQVLVSAPSANTTYAYVPVGTMNAEDGMTWAEWLTSKYNTTGLTQPEIRDSDYNEISYDTKIKDGGSYSLMEKNTGFVPGLYESGSNYTVLLKSWDSLVGYDFDADVRVMELGPGEYDWGVNPRLAGDFAIPNHLTFISQEAFFECTNITGILIPDSVTEIRDNAFYGCTGLTSITFEGTMEQWNKNVSKANTWNYNVPATEVICSDGTVALS